MFYTKLSGLLIYDHWPTVSSNFVCRLKRIITYYVQGGWWQLAVYLRQWVYCYPLLETCTQLTWICKTVFFFIVVSVYSFFCQIIKGYYSKCVHNMFSVIQAMYIRVKRSKTTYFLQCDPTETIMDIKQKVYALIDQPVNDQRLTLMTTGEVLEDSKTLADQKVLSINPCTCGNNLHFPYKFHKLY